MQIAGRLVGQQQRRFVNDSPRNANQLLLSAGKLVGIQVLLGDNLKMVERFGHHALPLTAWDVLVRQRQVDVFLHGQVVEQVIALEDHSDVALGQLGAIFALHQVHGCSRNQYSPAHWSSSRASTFSSDDLPAPDGPMTVINSPSRIVRSMRRNTQVCPAPVL